MSPSVFALITMAVDRVELAVLWRGTPGWFFGSARESSRHSAAGFEASLERGGVAMTVSYDATRKVAVVQGLTIPLTNGANVIMVDGVGAASGPTSAITARVEVVLSESTTFADMFRANPEIVSFLQCDAGYSGAYANTWLMAVACDDLR